MNRMSEIAKMFDLEIEEEFTFEGKTGTFKLTNDGLYSIERGYHTSNILMRMLSGLLKPVKKPMKWKPEFQEQYYVPNVGFNKLYDYHNWLNDHTDKRYYEYGIVCKTSEEAIEMAKKMLNAIKEEV